MKVTKKPTVRFSQKAFQQMFALTAACDIEISAMGIIATEEEKEAADVDEDFYVLEYFVVEQVCTGASTVMDPGALIDLMADLRERGIKPEQIVVWWHSHVNMDTGHSGTDETQIENFDFDHVCISAITNKKGDLNLRIDLMNPIRYSFEKCSYAVDQLDILPDNWAEDMVEEHVSKAVFKAERINVTKAPADATRNWGYSGFGGGYYSRATSANPARGSNHLGWDSFSDDTPVVQGHGVQGGYDAGPVEEVIEALDFPTELGALQTAYDENEIGANDAMELFSKFYAKEISKEEVIQELELVHGVEFVDEKDEKDEEVDNLLTFSTAEEAFEAEEADSVSVAVPDEKEDTND